MPLKLPCFAVPLVLSLLALTVAASAAEPPRISDVARASVRPDGAPGAADVVMRTLRWRHRTDEDPRDTMQALEAFHVTRLEWSYVREEEPIARVKASGRLFGGAVSAPSYVPDDPKSDWFERVVIRDAVGTPIIAPWKRTWKRTLWGCVNNPELERGYVEYLKDYVDAGAQVMQRDEPEANYLATRWGGCFCPHCMEAFRRYLADNTTADERKRLGIDSVETFDYGEHLRRQEAPIGDAFGRWDGGRLKQLFVDFQLKATLAFHRRTRKALDEHAGRHVPVSCNNGAHRWGPIQLEFAWAFGELSYGRARPATLVEIMREAARHNRIQVVTMPKKGDQDNLDAWLRRTRQTIGTAYAAGGLCMVPWDVYMPHDAPRYFGTAEQYADLFGFVRASADYLDGYEEAAVFCQGIEETRFGEALPVVPSRKEVLAIARARPGEPDAPVIVHLVDWSDQPEAFTVRLRPQAFFGNRPLAAKLHVPAPYDAAAHNEAERSGDFASLMRTAPVVTSSDGGLTTVEVPPIDAWAMLVITPAAQTTN